MPTLPLPKHTAPLSPAGFKKIYESLRGDPDAARAFAREIEADPRGVLEHVFRLTKGQQAAIGNTSDAELRKRGEALVRQLRSKTPRAMRFDPNASKRPPRIHEFTCTCMMLEEV